MKSQNPGLAEANKIIDDLKNRYGVKSDKELADIFEVSKGNIWNWRNKGGLPHFVLMIHENRMLVKNRDNSLESVPTDEIVNINKQAALAAASLDAILEHMDDADRQALFSTTLELRWMRDLDAHVMELREEIKALRKELKETKEKPGYASKD